MEGVHLLFMHFYSLQCKWLQNMSMSVAFFANVWTCKCHFGSHLEFLQLQQLKIDVSFLLIFELTILIKFLPEYQYPYKTFFKMNSNYLIFEIITLSEVQFLNLQHLFKKWNSRKITLKWSNHHPLTTLFCNCYVN